MDHNAAEGYLAIKKQSSKDVAVTPTVYVPYYSQSLATDPGFQSDEPVYGNLFKRLQTLPAIRSHGGSFSVMAEPNSIAQFFDHLSTRTATSGSDPYTHTFGPSLTAQPNYYTYDISFGSHVVRFWGVQASKLTLGWDGEKMVLNGDVAGLHSFYAREVASVSGSGPYTITLKTNYDPSPTDGLVASDIMRAYDVSAGTYINFSVSSVASVTTITTATDVSALADGDILVLRAATPSLAVLTPFVWPRTQFFFSDTAANALTASSTASNQTRLEPTTEIGVMYDFAEDGGSKRSGSFDPASLPRGVYDYEFKPKIFLDDPRQFSQWNTLTKRACVMRSYSESGYEIRVTMNNLRALTDETPTESAGIIYHEVTYQPNYDTSDGQGFDVKVINALSTI